MHSVLCSLLQYAWCLIRISHAPSPLLRHPCCFKPYIPCTMWAAAISGLCHQALHYICSHNIALVLNISLPFMFINPVLHLIITSTGNTNGYPKPIISPTVNPVLQAMADWSTGSYLLFAVLRISASTPYLMKWLGYSVTFSLFKVSVYLGLPKTEAQTAMRCARLRDRCNVDCCLPRLVLIPLDSFLYNRGQVVLLVKYVKDQTLVHILARPSFHCLCILLSLTTKDVRAPLISISTTLHSAIRLCTKWWQAFSACFVWWLDWAPPISLAIVLQVAFAKRGGKHSVHVLFGDLTEHLRFPWP